MLDQKIKSLTSNKTALVQEIDDREKVLRDMFNELIRESQMNSSCYMYIENHLKKLEILNERKKDTELKIFFWNTKMKEYHRSLTSAICSGKSTIEIGRTINTMLEKNRKVDVAKQLRELSKEDLTKKLVKMGGDMGTNVHEELLN